MSLVKQPVRPERSIASHDIVRAVQSGPETGPYLNLRHWLERGVAAVLLLLCSPLIVFLMALVRLTSPGPAIYQQIRLGWRGRPFVLFKLRTMYDKAEAESGPVWASEHDPRVTPLGRFLRFMHLDELPQLWNIVKGEMSFIGPRPERPEFVRVLMTRIPNYCHRMTVRPGIVGLSQVNLPPDHSFQSAQRKQLLDLEYIEQASPSLDLRISLYTGFLVFGIRSRALRHLLGLARQLDVPHDRDEVLISPSDVVDESESMDSRD